MVVEDQPATHEGQAGFGGVAEGLAVPLYPGNAGGGKGPWFKAPHAAAKVRRLGNLQTSEIIRRGPLRHTRKRGIGNSNALFSSQRLPAKALGHPLMRSFGSAAVC